MNNVDWELIRTFLVVAEQGSVSSAARQLGASQPTLSRHIRELERQIGLTLFERSPNGLLLTEHGEGLVDAAMRMGESADHFLRLASGLSAELAGELRISANEIVGYHLLPTLLTAFRERHPGIALEVVITNQASNLNKREADVALRMFRPSQPDLVVARLPDLELGFYGARDYLKRHGTPQTLDELLAHALIGFDQDPSFIEAAAGLGVTLGRDAFPLRTDHMLLHIALMRAGAGIGATHLGIAQGYPELVRVLPQIPLPRLEFWSVCHRDLRLNPRVQTLMRFMHEWFGKGPYHSQLI